MDTFLGVSNQQAAELSGTQRVLHDCAPGTYLVPSIHCFLGLLLCVQLFYICADIIKPVLGPVLLLIRSIITPLSVEVSVE